MLLCLLAFARAAVELVESKVAVGEERAHTARFGERQGLAVVGLTALGIEPIGMGREVAEQVKRGSQERGLSRRRFDRAIAQALRFVEPAEQQSGATQRVIGALPGDDSARRAPLEELLTFLQSVQRFARCAVLCLYPGGGTDREGEDLTDVFPS